MVSLVGLIAARLASTKPPMTPLCD